MNDTTVLTATGAEVDLRWPDPHTISVLDIAHHLALINRFAGATSRPYSVAEHSLLVVEILERRLGIADERRLLAGLLHDAHEAYLGDSTTPVKHLRAGVMDAHEARMQRTILTALRLQHLSWLGAEQIRRADLIALATERRDLLPHGRLLTPWPCLSGIEPLSDVDLATRTQFGWQDWRDAFVERFGELREPSHVDG